MSANRGEQFYGKPITPEDVSSFDELARELEAEKAQAAPSMQPAPATEQAIKNPEHRAVIEEAAQVLESAAAHNRGKGRTVLAHTQQDRADRLRIALDAKSRATQAERVQSSESIDSPELVVDAARYRWLRSNNIVTNVRFHFASGDSPYLYAEALDEAIDHNMGYDPLADARRATASKAEILRSALVAARDMVGHPDNIAIIDKALEAASKAEAPAVDVCAEMRALCSACGGTGDVTSIDGEWRGSCDCEASAWSRSKAEAAPGVEVLERIAAQMRQGGASLPAPPNLGTAASALVCGLSIGLLLVQVEIDRAIAATTKQGTP